MATPLTLLKKDCDRIQLTKILDPHDYHVQEHNSEAVLLVLKTRIPPERELLLDLYISVYGYRWNDDNWW